MSRSNVHVEMINLAGAADRRAQMAPELSGAALEPDVHPAFDYREAPDGALDRNTQAEGPWGVFHTQDRAVTISHAQAWQRFADSGQDYCLVIEDDVFLSPELSDWLEDMAWWPADADLVKLERWHLSDKLRILLEQPGREYLGRRIARMLSRHTGAAGYMLTRHAAQQLLAAKPYDLTVDQLLFNLNASRLGLRVYQVTPALLQQGNLPGGQIGAYENRKRPSGAALRRQKILRAWYEVAYPLSTFFKALTGRARLETVPYERYAITPLPSRAMPE